MPTDIQPIQMSLVSENIRIAADVINGADGLLITAGAGMGVDSGLPDFRGDEGFWKAYPALRQAGINFQTIASPGCVFRAKLDTDSAANWTVIPAQTGHGFRGKLDS